MKNSANSSAQSAAALMDDKRTRLNIDFIGKRKIYYTISISLILIGILVSVIFGVKLSIAFTGGAIFKYSYTGDVDKNAAQTVVYDTVNANRTNKLKVSTQTDVIKDTNTNRLVFSVSPEKGGEKFSISSTEQQAIKTALQTKFKDNKIDISETRNVNADMGSAFLRKSILAVLLASALIVLYIWIRFRTIGGLPAGLTAFVALLHDVMMAFAAFSIFRIPLDDNFIAVVLTILGFSINDTIVIYDRIRENRRLYGSKVHFKDIVNKSINQSFARSVNTTLCAFFAIAVICVFSIIYNLDSIRSFALPMMVGVITGCYSTICIAGPLWVTWVTHKEKLAEAAKQNKKKLSPKKA